MNFITTSLSQIDWLVFAKYLVQLFIIVYATLWLWKRIAGTQAARLVNGVLVLGAAYLVFHLLGFSMITSILRHTVPAAIITAVIIFQPEIRRGLGYLGRMKSFQLDFSLPDNEAADLSRDVNQIIVAVRELSRNKSGALIVIEPPEADRYYLSPGTEINADISTGLLLSIFFPRSPLHDGAVIVRQHKIISAGVILPMTDNPKLSHQYGTRHRAAIGLSEIYDCLCIVVSEETGVISTASRGTLVSHSNAEELAEAIASVYQRHGVTRTSHLVAAITNLVPFSRRVVPSSTLKKKMSKSHSQSPKTAGDQGATSI